MRRESKAERAAWTALVDGQACPRTNKYGNEKSGGYASKHEADIAGKLATLQRMGTIRDLKEQVRITLVPASGKIRASVYVADFTWFDAHNVLHVGDAKGFKTPVYRLKKKLAALLLNVTIEEL